MAVFFGNGNGNIANANIPALAGFVGGNAAQLGDAIGDIFFAGGGNDVILAGNGNDLILGEAGNDVLAGRGGADFIFGGIGNDALAGGAGNDTVVGGDDRDTMSGGGGADDFVFVSTSDSGVGPGTLDFILDFNSGGAGVVDQIDLSAIDAIPGGGDDDFDFRGNLNFNDVGQVRFVIFNNDTFVEINTAGDATPEMRIQLDGLHNLGANDFIL